jgi:hypothetical protein
MNKMTTDRTAPHKSHAMTRVVTTLIAIPVIYVLSIGPVEVCGSRAYDGGAISMKTFKAIWSAYAPLCNIAESSPRMEHLIDVYENFWFKITGTPLVDPFWLSPEPGQSP